MLKLRTTSKFRKDYKRIKKRGYDLALFEEVLEKLLNQEPLEARCKDHALIGSYSGFRECHIQPDWLFVYAIEEEQLILVAAGTGTHADLFNM